VVDYFTGIPAPFKYGSTTVSLSLGAADRLLAAECGPDRLRSGGAQGAHKETIAGANDIGMSSRELTADEASTLSYFP
jgi:ABC-type phosphate transport system substrate-binding protein